jgi:hypothetical protein
MQTIPAAMIDGDVVKTSGDQTIAGTKTFSTRPVQPAIPAFSVYRNSGQTISAFATVAADAEEYDATNSVASGVFTAPVAGYYLFTGYAAAATTPCLTQIRFSKNAGAANYAGTYMTGNANAVSQCAMLRLAQGDTVAMQVFFSVSQSIGAGLGGNFFQGVLLRAE